MAENQRPSGDAASAGAIPVRSMAAATGVAAASIYYSQPMLGLLAQDFPSSRLVALIPTATQLGYALGLFFLVPLGDLVERRRLIVVQFLALAAALAATAASPTVGVLLAASVVLGICATAAQQVVPLSAHLAPPARRGAIVGAVMAGLLGGILLSRTVAGVVSQAFGWQAIFAIAAPVSVLTALWLRRVLPVSPPDGKLGYGRLMVSMAGLWREFPELRRAALTQAMIFGAFGVFWTVLALLLSTPHYGLGPAAAGSFGLLGLTGILAAPLAGRAADRIGPQRVVVLGAVVSAASWAVFGFWGSLIGLGVGVVLLDFGVQVAMVSNQSMIYALRPEARARINTLYMGTMFIGGATGAALAAEAWHHGGWTAVCILGAAMTLVAVAIQLSALSGPRASLSPGE